MPRHVPRRDRREARRLSALALLALALLSGCARGLPASFRVESSHLRYRPATPSPMARAAPARQALPEAPEVGPEEEAALARREEAPEDEEAGADCGEPLEEDEEALPPALEGAPVVRLETGEGPPLHFTPRVAPSPVVLEEAAFAEALTSLVLELRLALVPLPSGPGALLASASRGEKLDMGFGMALRPEGRWCRSGESPEDGCQSLLEDGLRLGVKARVQLALGFALDSVWDGVALAVQDTISPRVLWAMVTGALGAYVLLLAAPDPLITKGVALLLTVYMLAYLGAVPFRDMWLAARALKQEAEAAHTLEELDRAGQRFGRVLGEQGTRVVVMLVLASLGGGPGLAARGRMLPGFGQAGLVAELQVGLRLAAADHVRSVVLTPAGALVVGLAPTALAMAASNKGSGQGATPAAARQGRSPGKAHEHHIASNKFDKSTLNGGPWTPRFRRIFAKAGMTLNHKANKVAVKNHKGPHPQEYHEIIFERLLKAVNTCTTKQQCQAALTQELKNLAREISTPGTHLNQLVTN